MGNLSYYYNILYTNDLFQIETNKSYKEWLKKNYPPYDKLKNL